MRETDGLALSSRNARLTPAQRQQAVAISQALWAGQKQKNNLAVAELKQSVIDQINAIPELQVEYFDLVDRDSLQSIRDWKDSAQVVGCIAVYAGKVRLIDNVLLCSR